MEDSLPIKPRKWNSRHVRAWLKEKGFAYSIQNRFFGERIDGEALLLLTSSHINNELLADYPLGDKIKIKSYIDKLKLNGYHKEDRNKQKQHRSKEIRPRKRRRNYSCHDDNNLFIHNPSKKKTKLLFKNQISHCIISNPSILPTNTHRGINRKKLRKNHNNHSYRSYNREIERMKAKLKNTNFRSNSIIRTHQKQNKNHINTSNINSNKRRIMMNDNKNNSNNTNTTKNESKNVDKNGKIRDKRYSNNHKHDTSNHGKRWNKNDLEIMWGLHQKGFSNLQIAEKFKRTECGIMVQIDKRYKDLRAHKDMKEVVELRKKAINKHIKRQKGELTSDDEETQSEDELFQNQDSSWSDDDELVINYFRRNKSQQQNESNPSNQDNNNSNNHQLQQALNGNVKELLGV